MWRKLYSNLGLILIAILGVGVWANVYQSVKAPEPYSKYSDFDKVVGDGETPTLTPEEILGIAQSPSPTSSANDLFAEFMRRGRPSHTPGPFNPVGATARCRDGSYYYAANHRGACSHHGGVSQWLR